MEPIKICRAPKWVLYIAYDGSEIAEKQRVQRLKTILSLHFLIQNPAV